MARIIRFDPSLRTADGGRFPRFDEVGAQVDAQANRIFDAETSISGCRELYARVEARLTPDDRPLLRELYEAIVAHQEHYEHAAYLVGLRAGAGKLEGLPPALADERDPGEGPRTA